MDLIGAAQHIPCFGGFTTKSGILENDIFDESTNRWARAGRCCRLGGTVLLLLLLSMSHRHPYRGMPPWFLSLAFTHSNRSDSSLSSADKSMVTRIGVRNCCLATACAPYRPSLAPHLFVLLCLTLDSLEAHFYPQSTPAPFFIARLYDQPAAA